ncbi:hypothetical protein [Kitasatospora sp. NPDC057738]|uniref:hypothetical protein n=1 Tax=Kitasatospora sp. NPDC057738 TaxID=3346233 RepID=UPI003694E5B0
MDQLDLDAIQARTDAATPGPWWADDTDIIVGTSDDLQPHPVWIGETANPGTPNGGLANAQFIAAARTDVPALLDRVRELTADLAEMTHCRDNAIRALRRDDIDTDLDIEDTIANEMSVQGWDWEDDDAPRTIATILSPVIRPALAKATQQRDEALARVRQLEAEQAATKAPTILWLAEYDGTEPTLWSTEGGALEHCSAIARTELTSWDWIPEDGGQQIYRVHPDTDEPLGPGPGRVTPLTIQTS